MGRTFWGGAIQPLLTLGVSGCGRGLGDIMVVGVRASEGGEQVMFGLQSYGIKNFKIFKKFQVFFKKFFKLQFPTESNETFPAKMFSMKGNGSFF